MDKETVHLNNERFWRIYETSPGGRRRRLLYAMFVAAPDKRLYVNNKWQPSTKDPDLKRLLKEGKIRQGRSGGRYGHHHPLNRSSAKRESYLILVEGKND
jgi:hypothetical protein